jgi:hypothetical protein
VTADRSAAIAAAEATLAVAQDEVARLQAQLADEQAAEPRRMSWEDGVAAARRRHPGRTKSERAARGTADTGSGSGTAAGIAEARRRAALRGGAA